MGLWSKLRRWASQSDRTEAGPARAQRRLVPGASAVVPLERRELPTTIPLGATVDIDAIEQTDAKNVRLTYTVEPGVSGVLPGSTLSVAVYRSSDNALDPNDRLLGRFGAGLTANLASQTISTLELDPTPGQHAIDLTFPAAMEIDLQRPYLIVAVQASTATGAVTTIDSQAIHKHTIAVYTHGGLQDTPGNRLPADAAAIGRELREAGFEKVLVYNWVGDSWSPGRAATNGPKLAHQIRKIVAQFPDDEPVDIHFLGHSEGTVVNSVAIRNLYRHPVENLDRGTMVDTLLDPHPANYSSKFRQYSVKPSFLGWLAQIATDWYEASAKDPPSAIMPNVDKAEVYYQHTYYAFAPNSTWTWENLWGTVPVPVVGDLQPQYVDITGTGISHAGFFGVVDWYRTFVLPTLGTDNARQATAILTAAPNATDVQITSVDPALGQIAGRTNGTARVLNPRFSGTTWAGATVRLTAAPRGQKVARPYMLGTTTADESGRWEIAAKSLPPGRYQVMASAVVPILAEHPRVKMTPRVRVGILEVDLPARLARPARSQPAR